MMADNLNTAVYGLRRSAIREFSSLAKSAPGCISLTLGEPDFDTPERVREEVKSSLDNGETHYIENNGSKFLREAIADFERGKNGMDYTADEVIVTAGATEALFTALFGIINPGDEVIIPTPAFVLYEEIVKLCRGKAVKLDTSADGFDINGDRLNALITDKTKAIILNSPNNPTGKVYGTESLNAVYDIVRSRDIFVICDDVYRQLVYVEDYRSFSEFRDLREKLIVVQSFSKSYAMTGWRMGYLLADKSVKNRLELIHQFMIVSTPAMFQRAGREALRFDSSVFARELKGRRDYVLKRLEDMGLEAVKPEGAFYVFPSIEEFGLTSADFCRRMIDEARLAVTPGFCFGGEGHIRISYCASDDVLREGLDRLERFVKSLR